MIGVLNARPPKNEYYGIACSKVCMIFSINKYEIFHTPLLNKSVLNYSHCDIYDTGNPPIPKGEALSAKMSYEREEMVKIWSVYMHDAVIQKMFIIPPDMNKKTA